MTTVNNAARSAATAPPLEKNGRFSWTVSRNVAAGAAIQAAIDTLPENIVATFYIQPEGYVTDTTTTITVPADRIVYIVSSNEHRRATASFSRFIVNGTLAVFRCDIRLNSPNGTDGVLVNFFFGLFSASIFNENASASTCVRSTSGGLIVSAGDCSVAGGVTAMKLGYGGEQDNRLLDVFEGQLSVGHLVDVKDVQTNLTQNEPSGLVIVCPLNAAEDDFSRVSDIRVRTGASLVCAPNVTVFNSGVAGNKGVVRMDIHELIVEQYSIPDDLALNSLYAGPINVISGDGEAEIETGTFVTRLDGYISLLRVTSPHTRVVNYANVTPATDMYVINHVCNIAGGVAREPLIPVDAMVTTHDKQTSSNRHQPNSAGVGQDGVTSTARAPLPDNV